MSGLLIGSAAAVVGAYAFRSSGMDRNDGNTGDERINAGVGTIMIAAALYLAWRAGGA